MPKFFRWLSERYPLVCQTVDPVQMKPEFDYLYLDMNGIIHNCTHGDGLTRSMSEADIMAKVFQYIDKLFNTVVPQKVFFMAIDGVAPRAKMNQQRSRRFRSAHDAKEQLLGAESMLPCLRRALVHWPRCMRTHLRTLSAPWRPTRLRA